MTLKKVFKRDATAKLTNTVRATGHHNDNYAKAKQKFDYYAKAKGDSAKQDLAKQDLTKQDLVKQDLVKQDLAK